MPVTASRNPPLEPRPRAELPLWLQALVWHDGLRLLVTVGAPILALVVVLAFFGFQLLGSIAREQDSNWADHTRSLVRKSLDRSVALNANVALDYGNWSDAWLATRGELDEAWLEPNFQTVVASALAVWRPGTGVRYLFTDERAEGRAESLRAVVDDRDERRIAALINADWPGAARFVSLRDTEHGFAISGGAPFNPLIAIEVADWIDAIRN